MALLIKNIITYKELKPLYDEYKKSCDKEKYLHGHESEIILFEAVSKALKAFGVSGKLSDPTKLKAKYKRLIAEKDALYTEYGKLKKQLQEYDAVKQNIDSVLYHVCGCEQEKRCNCTDNHTLFIKNLLCHCRYLIDNDTLSLYNIMCNSRK